MPQKQSWVGVQLTAQAVDDHYVSDRSYDIV